MAKRELNVERRSANQRRSIIGDSRASALAQVPGELDTLQKEDSPDPARID